LKATAIRNAQAAVGDVARHPSSGLDDKIARYDRALHSSGGAHACSMNVAADLAQFAQYQRFAADITDHAPFYVQVYRCFDVAGHGYFGANHRRLRPVDPLA